MQINFASNQFPINLRGTEGAVKKVLTEFERLMMPAAHPVSEKKGEAVVQNAGLQEQIRHPGRPSARRNNQNQMALIAAVRSIKLPGEPSPRPSTMTRGMRKSHFLMFRLRGLSPDSSGWPLRQDNLAESEWRRRDPRLVGAFHGLCLTREACDQPRRW